AAGPSTEISVEQVSVAGHAAYELVLTPRTEDTLVASVAVAVEGETGLPLRVTVRARGQEEPAVQAGFTSLDLSAPDPDLFDFTRPPGATVVEEQWPGHHGLRGRSGGDGPRRPSEHGGLLGDVGPDQLPAVGGPVVHGSGWDAVLALPAGPGVKLPPDLTQPVDGGRLLSTALVNVLVTDDGTVLLGAVPVERLQAVAGA
ncbi:hypothetical protein PU560_14580, partial [Georgenia sp. 10Sc9-8]|nr:hypothetical protein [Georgenia halotolerans]